MANNSSPILCMLRCFYESKYSTSRIVGRWKQVQHFKNCRTILADVVGDKNVSGIIRNALFICGMGTNELVINSFGLLIRLAQMKIEQHLEFLLNEANNFIQKLAIKLAIPINYCRISEKPAGKTFKKSRYRQLHQEPSGCRTESVHLADRSRVLLLDIRLPGFGIIGRWGLI